VLLFLAGLRLFAVVFGTVFSYVAAAAVAYYFARRISPFDFGRTRARFVSSELFYYSLPLVLARFMTVVMGRANTILVGYYRDSISTGLFGAAVQLAPFVSLSLLSFSKIFCPVISELWEKGDVGGLEVTFKTVSKWIFSLAFPVFLILMLYASPLLSVFGPEFARAAATLRLLAIAQMTNALVGPAGYVLSMTGRQKLNLVNSIALVVPNIILNIFLIPRYGIAGAGISTVISMSGINVVRVIEVKLLYGFTPFRRDIFKPIAAGAIAFLGFGLLGRFAVWPDVPHTLALCAAFLAAYVGLLFLFGLREEKEVLLEILKRRK